MHDVGVKKESQSIASNVSNVDNDDGLEVKEESKIKIWAEFFKFF